MQYVNIGNTLEMFADLNIYSIFVFFQILFCLKESSFESISDC